MRTLRVPHELVGEVAALPERLTASAQARGVPPDLLEGTINSLGSDLLQLPCFFDRLTKMWGYDFGLSIALRNDQAAFGVHTYTPVDELLDVLFWVRRRLPDASRNQYLHRLADESRHQDALVEVLAVRVLPDDLPIRFEVPAEVGHGTVDWCLEPTEGGRVLFDVKNRTADLVSYLDVLVTMPRGAEAPPPAHASSVLFRSVSNKFEAHDPGTCSHGVWVFTRVKQEEAELTRAFAALDPCVVHFAVVSNWKRECRLLLNPGVNRERLVRILRLSENKARITFEKSS
ncbi:MAG: hypothetical protein AB1898_18245 [Acidobacteriota bacterium]